MDFETTVKMEIYRTIADTAKVPSSPEVARALGASVEAPGDPSLALKEVLDLQLGRRKSSERLQRLGALR